MTEPRASRSPDIVRRRPHVHPVEWIGPVAGSVVALVAWVGIARSSGSGWVQAIGCLVAAFLVVGMVAPVVTARRIRLTCTGSPHDARAGQPFDVSIESDRPVRIRPLYPGGAGRQSGGRVLGPRTVVVPVTLDHRGLVDAVVVEAGSSAPFGLVWWVREFELPLPHLVHVAPRVGSRAASADTSTDAPGAAVPRVPSSLGEPRGIRPYAAGDPRRAVHWPATSHAGALMVRESERPTDDPVHVEVVLPSDPGEAEAEAERVMAGVSDLLAKHRSVVLATLEESGRVERPVADQVDLGRRLARTVPIR